MPDQALSGLRVLELSHYISGPFCARLLAGLGAEVIKVEPSGQGDPARRMGPFPEDKPHSEKSGLFLYLNSNKKSITLNLETETGARIFKNLVRDSDIVVENFEPKVMPSLGLSYQELEKVNPGLIMTSISYFGQSGPYRDYKATNLIGYAMGGMMYVTGETDREPLLTGGYQADYHGGLNGFVATLTALYCRDLTGIGQHVDVSIMECLASVLEYKIEMYSFQGAIGGRWYSRHPFSWPHGDIYPCKDGYIAVPPRPDWNDFSVWLGKPELAEERFSTLSNRLQNKEQFDAILTSGLEQKGKEEFFHSGQEWRFGTGYVATTEDLAENPHLKERGFIVQMDHPEAGRLAYPGLPFKLSETPCQLRPAPLLGENNTEIYCDRLGYSRQDLVKLRQAGII